MTRRRRYLNAVLLVGIALVGLAWAALADLTERLNAAWTFADDEPPEVWT